MVLKKHKHIFISLLLIILCTQYVTAQNFSDARSVARYTDEFLVYLTNTELQYIHTKQSLQKTITMPQASDSLYSFYHISGFYSILSPDTIIAITIYYRYAHLPSVLHTIHLYYHKQLEIFIGYEETMKSHNMQQYAIKGISCQQLDTTPLCIAAYYPNAHDTLQKPYFINKTHKQYQYYHSLWKTSMTYLNPPPDTPSEEKQEHAQNQAEQSDNQDTTAQSPIVPQEKTANNNK